MKRYNITVNGTAYDVAVEEVEAGAAPVAAPATPKAAPKAAAPKASTGAQGSVKVTAPMPGTVVAVKIKPGDTVTANTVVAVIEALKMENDIVAGKDGVIASVNVNKGDSVETDTVIATINA